MVDPVTDMTLAAATSGIILRSERQSDLRVLEDTFVDSGIMAQLVNRNSQILYGRRGTGKSHLLRVLAARAQRDSGDLAVYADLRTLGSAQLMTDASRGISARSVSVFKDLLSLLQHQLLDHSIALDGRGLEAVSDFADSIRTVTSVITERETTDEWQNTRAKESSGGAKLSIKDISIEGQGKDRWETTSKRVGRYSEIFENTVVFAEVAHQLDAALRDLGTGHLYLLIDEWPSIPIDVQPYVAEFLKRTVLPSTRITIKIASLEYGSAFSERDDGGRRIGFEIGGDIFANLDLDDYYSYDRNSARAVQFFGELLFRHLAAELPAGYLGQKLGFETSRDLVAGLFADDHAFEGLVRASEGVIRDFLGIYTHTFFQAMRSGRPAIEADAVHTASLEWFEIDKLPNLDERLYRLYQWVVDEVIGRSRSPYFLLERGHTSDPAIRALFDLRLIHLVKRGLTREAQPGTRYNLYALDFGTYATTTSISSDDPSPADPRELRAADVVVLRPLSLDS